MTKIRVAIGTKLLAWDMPRCEVRELMKVLVHLYGEPNMGEVGSPRREITVEPVPTTVPVPETVPEAPVPA